MSVMHDSPAAAGAGAPRDRSDAGGNIFPPRDTFAAAYNAGHAQVVWTRLVADLETPVSAYLKLTRRRRRSTRKARTS